MTIVGNFMADGVKGRDLSAYSEGLQKGIRMHRHIDSYTDGHPLTLQGRERLRAHCGKYAGVALDLFYDHAIAQRWSELNPEPLPDFTQRMYALLTEHEALMPDRARNMLPYMVQYDWLNSYTTIEGIGRALLGLSRRTPAGSLLAGAEAVLEQHHAAFERECLEFIPQLRAHLNSEHA